MHTVIEKGGSEPGRIRKVLQEQELAPQAEGGCRVSLRDKAALRNVIHVGKHSSTRCMDGTYPLHWQSFGGKGQPQDDGGLYVWGDG
jgi:hypothetical protein